jgi:hypothetical protein
MARLCRHSIKLMLTFVQKNGWTSCNNRMFSMPHNTMDHFVLGNKI